MKNARIIKEIIDSKCNQAGITLIALVITIIVLLILASVTISLTLGERGIFKTAIIAKDKYSQKQAEEKLKLILLDIETENVINEETEKDNYVINKLKEKGFDISNDIVIVDDWMFKLDIEKLGIIESLGKSKKPKIINGKITIDETKIDVSIELVNVEKNNISYIIKKSNTSDEIANIKTEKQNYTFTNLEAGEKYDIVIRIENSYGTDIKIVNNVETIINSIPVLKANNKNIINNRFVEDEYTEWGHTTWYHAFDGNSNTVAWSDTPGLNAAGSWIGYDFVNPICVNKVIGKIRFNQYKVEYSDNLEAWTTVIVDDVEARENGIEFEKEVNENNGAHRYWRIYISKGCPKYNWASVVYTLQFYGVTQKQIINI